MDPLKLGAKAQTVVYGMTETSPVTFGCDVDAPIVNRCETVGRVYPHVHAKIVSPDDEDGKPLPVGQPGELCVSCHDRTPQKAYADPSPLRLGPHFPRTTQILYLQTAGYVTMHGYWKDPQRTHEALQVHSDEPEITWMRTGDLGTIDEQGYVRIVGRSKDVIIRGGTSAALAALGTVS